jgi:chromosome segregation ATPase
VQANLEEVHGQLVKAEKQIAETATKTAYLEKEKGDLEELTVRLNDKINKNEELLSKHEKLSKVLNSNSRSRSESKQEKLVDNTKTDADTMGSADDTSCTSDSSSGSSSDIFCPVVAAQVSVAFELAERNRNKC